MCRTVRNSVVLVVVVILCFSCLWTIGGVSGGSGDSHTSSIRPFNRSNLIHKKITNVDAAADSTESMPTTVESVDKDLPNMVNSTTTTTISSANNNIADDNNGSGGSGNLAATTTTTATTSGEEGEDNESSAPDDDDEDYDDSADDDSGEGGASSKLEKDDADSRIDGSDELEPSSNSNGGGGGGGNKEDVEEDSDDEDYYTSNHDDGDGEDGDDDGDEEDDEDYEEERCTLKSFLSTMNITEMLPADREQLIREYDSFGEDPREKIRLAPSVNHTFSRLDRLMNLARNIASQQELRSGLTNFLHHNFDLFLELDLGPECLNSIIAILVAIRRNEMWALKFFDSAPKLPSGLLAGVGSYLGSYDQCISITNPASHAETYAGQYCIIKPLLPLPETPWTVAKEPMDDEKLREQTERILSFYSHYNVDQYLKTNPVLKFVEIMKSNKGRVTNFAICLPDSCTAEQLETSLNKFLYPIIGIPLEIQESSCWTEEKTKDYSLYLDGHAKFALIVIGTLAALVLSATLYELYPCLSFQNNNYHPNSHHLNHNHHHHHHLNPHLPNPDEPRSSSSAATRMMMLKSQGTPIAILIHSWVTVFSAMNNTRRLMWICRGSTTSSNHSNRLMVFDTLRLIIVILIGLCTAFYHTPLSQALHNLAHSVPHELLTDPKYFFIRAPSLLNDGLLIIAGALFVRSIFAHLIRPHDTRTYLLYFLQRWIRLTTPLFGSILFLYLLPSTGHGPLWYRLVEILLPACQSPSSLASSLFHYSNWNFVRSNYTNDETFVVCNPDTWFISIIFQLNIAFFMIVLLMYQCPKKGLRFLIILIIASILLNISPRLFFPNTRTYYELARQPSMWHVRRSFYMYHQNILQYVGSFAVGLLLGYAIIVNDNVTKDPKSNTQSRVQKKTLIYNTLAILGIIAPFIWVNQFFNPNHTPNELSVLLFFSLGRFLFSLSFAWLIYVCVSRKSPWLSSLITPTFLQPIARLSFAIFLVQPLVQYHRLYSVKETYVMTFRNTIEHYVCDFFLSTFLAYILYLLFEAPACQFNRLLRKRTSRRRSKNDDDSSLEGSGGLNGKQDYWCDKDKMTSTPSLSDGLDGLVNGVGDNGKITEVADTNTIGTEQDYYEKNGIISIRF